MTTAFPGKGQRRPLIDLPLSKIKLDVNNPRLAKKGGSTTEFDLIKTLYDEFDLQELAMSMSENGYFDEEPIIVVPKELPPELSLTDDIPVEQLQQQLKDLIDSGKIEFVVVEGNRRVSTAKILTDPELRQQLKIREGSFQLPVSEEIADDLRIIPAIVYADRKLVAPYLGVRHITGMLKWDAYAKAVYIAQSIEAEVEAGNSYESSLKSIQQQVADRSDVIRRQYLCYRVMRLAEEDFQFDTKQIKDKFSLLTVALGSPSIREYIGCESYLKVNFSERVIPADKAAELKNLLTWVYGDGTKNPVLTDSRKINSLLSPVLASKEATAYLLQFGKLEEAYERSSGEKDYIIRKIVSAYNAVTFAQGYVEKYKRDDDMGAAIESCAAAIHELQKKFNAQ